MADDDVTPSKSLFEALAESAPDAIITIGAGSIILSANAAVRRVFSGFIRDISERFHQQRALKEAHDDLQLQAHLLSSVAQAVISTDVAGTVLTWNEFAAALYGWSADEATGRKLSEVVPPVVSDDEHESGDAMRQRRRVEEQYLQAQKMDAIGRLAGGIAHDFNNLLTVITGHAELLASQIPPPTEAGTDVGEIVKAAARAAALTRQLLAFSRQQSLDQQPLAVNAVITDIERMLSRLLDARIELKVDLAADVPVVIADHGQLEQVIVNLVVNARDAMPNGGKLCVRTRRVVLHDATPDRPAGTYATLAVSDEGHGMTPEVRGRIFEPFYTTKEQGKGTGLGLATVYGIVKQSRGSSKSRAS